MKKIISIFSDFILLKILTEFIQRYSSDFWRYKCKIKK